MTQPNNLYSPDIYNQLLLRIQLLKPNSKPQWGIMNVAQMMAHVSSVMKNGLNETKLPRRMIGYFIAPFWRHKYFNEQPYKIKNLPTDDNFRIASDKDFEIEKEQLLHWIKVFHFEGKQRTKGACHPLLGKFTPNQWAVGQYKHLDHHLRQFGV